MLNPIVAVRRKDLVLRRSQNLYTLFFVINIWARSKDTLIGLIYYKNVKLVAPGHCILHGEEWYCLANRSDNVLHLSYKELIRCGNRNFETSLVIKFGWKPAMKVFPLRLDGIPMWFSLCQDLFLFSHTPKAHYLRKEGTLWRSPDSRLQSLQICLHGAITAILDSKSRIV